MLKPTSCITPPNRENSMSIETMAPDRVCYIQCNFCNTVLAVNVPSSTVCPTIVTVRCGYCANLLPINMAAALQPISHQAQLQLQQPHKPNIGSEEGITKASGSSSKGKKFTSSFESTEQDQPRMPPIRPPEKRQRVPSAYNRFIKEEIQRIKASNPDISHREAFSTAAKNWAHFPHIHFGLKLDNGSNKQAKLDHHHSSFTSATSTDHHHNKSHAAGFY